MSRLLEVSSDDFAPGAATVLPRQLSQQAASSPFEQLLSSKKPNLLTQVINKFAIGVSVN